MYHAKQILAQTLNTALDELNLIVLIEEPREDAIVERHKFLSEVIISCDKALVYLESVIEEEVA